MASRKTAFESTRVRRVGSWNGSSIQFAAGQTIDNYDASRFQERSSSASMLSRCHGHQLAASCRAMTMEAAQLPRLGSYHGDHAAWATKPTRWGDKQCRAHDHESLILAAEYFRPSLDRESNLDNRGRSPFAPVEDTIQAQVRGAVNHLKSRRGAKLDPESAYRSAPPTAKKQTPRAGPSPLVADDGLPQTTSCILHLIL